MYRHSKNHILQSISAGKEVFYWVVKGQGIWERDGVEVWGQQMQTTVYGMDK